MTTENEFMRYAGPNEQRTISREDLGFYNAVIIGATYDFKGHFHRTSPDIVYSAVKECIEKHPFFCVVVEDTHTDKASYLRVPKIHLEDHVFICDEDSLQSDQKNIEDLLAANLDRPFTRSIPPWRVLVLPLQQAGCCFVAFCYSHTIGDGPTGVSFHRTFLQACSSDSESTAAISKTISTPASPLSEPFDTAKRFPVSWSFLLQPILGLILPHFCMRLLGLSTGLSAATAATWTGSITFYDPKTTKSKVKLQKIEAPLLKRAIEAARAHDAKLTALFQQLVVRGLSKTIPEPHFREFISSTTINLRKAGGIPHDEAGEFVTGYAMTHPRISTHDMATSLTVESWEAAATATRKLAEAAATLHNQVVALLRYLPSIRKWTQSQVGQPRAQTFEVSNIGSFDPVSNPSVRSNERVTMTNMIFSQPRHVINVPLTFNLAGIKNGPLTYTVTWESGYLGYATDVEDRIVDEICESIRMDFENL